MTKRLKKRFLEALAQAEAGLAERWVSAAHRRLLKAQWKYPPQPEHFDHTIDLYFQFRQKRSSFWVERGVFSAMSLKGGPVLELACGDGFCARQFFSRRASRVIAVDFDPDAIATAQRKNPADNVSYLLADIRTDMPEGVFDNVVWDAAIEHFTPDEITKIMADIKARLGSAGILSGYTIVERDDGQKMLEHHEYEFKGMADLKSFLDPHFRNVTVFETFHPERHNLYFWASDGPVPFSDDWPHVLTKRG